MHLLVVTGMETTGQEILLYFDSYSDRVSRPPQNMDSPVGMLSTQYDRSVPMHRIHPVIHALGVSFALLMPAIADAQHWTQIPLGTNATIRDIGPGGGFSDRWLVGDGGFVAQSDASRTVWTPFNVGTSADLHSVRRPASNQIWVSGTGGIVRVTGDFGSTWLVRNAPTSQRVVMYSRESGCQNALGSAGSLHQTCNFGVNWNNLTSDTAVSLNHGAGFITSTSWIVGDAGTILHSTDGGVNWTPQTSGTDEDLHHIIEAGGGWKVIVGDNGTVLRSVDGGTTWIAAALSTDANLWSVSSSGQNGAWLLAVGQQGTVLKSTDTGASWCQLYPETNVDLYAGTMVSNSEYIVAGDGGIMMRTTDGGGTCRTPTAAGDISSPTTFALRGPHPQPVDGSGRFHLRVGRGQWVRARMFDLRGRVVADIFEGDVSSGVEHVMNVDTSKMPAGTYFLRVTGETFETARKITVVR